MPEPIEVTNMKKNCDSREYVLNAVTNQGSLLDYASDELKNDKQIVLAAINNNPEALEFASDKLKEDKEVVYNSVSKVGWTYCYAKDNLLKDKDLLRAGLKIDGQILLRRRRIYYCR